MKECECNAGDPMPLPIMLARFLCVACGFGLRVCGWSPITWQHETLRLDLEPGQVAASGTLMCGTGVITDLKKDR